MQLLIWQRLFWSVGSHVSLHTVEKLLFWKFGVGAFFLCKVTSKTFSVTKQLQCLCCLQTIYHQFVYILPSYDLLWWLVPEKIAFCLQCSGTKYLNFIGAKQSTPWLVVMVHSVLQITLLLDSFDVVLPSESKKLSWINWTVEIFKSPLIHWFLLGWFPALMLCFQVSHSATYCAQRSLTS